MKKLWDLVTRAAGPGAVGLERSQTWERLALRRWAWAAAMDGAEGRIGLHLDDGFEFAAALLGAWSRGLSVVLPGDAAPETLSALRSQASLSFIGDAAAPPQPQGGTPGLSAAPDIPLVVFTSGSTGDPVAIAKPWRCLDNEVSALESAFGPALEGCSLLSTVSHQHYYGLLFKVLWPLAAGRPFAARQLRLPEEIAAAAQDLRRCALVSSPALLKRIGGTPASLQALAPAKASLAAVFSSGGPLPWDAVNRCRLAFGPTPTEVYGSSETGGVAWRRRAAEGDPWTPLPGVETALGEGGLLELRSMHAAGEGWMKTEDLARAVEGGFQILGRADRIVKIEEKRVSLAALESRLASHPLVAEARVLVLEGVREQLGAVLRLKAPAPPEAGARRALAAALRLHLQGVAEAAALPRRWRFVDALPADSMGKSSQSALRALFKDEAVQDPECVLVQALDMGVEMHLYLPEALHWFQGHFPGHPILPGVVQLHWAVQAAREQLAVTGVFRGMQALKFMRPLRPGMRVSLILEPRPGGFEFRYVSAEGRHASGRVLLG